MFVSISLKLSIFVSLISKYAVPVDNCLGLLKLTILTKCCFHLHSKYLVQILVHSHFALVSFLLALEATELVSESVTQIALELINNHFISVQQTFI